MPVVVIPNRGESPSSSPLGAEVPDLVGFAAALDRKRQALGSDVCFLQPEVVTFPSGTPLDADGNPYDPTVAPMSSAQSSAWVRCGVFFKAVNRGGAAGAAIDTAIGIDEHTRIFAIAPSAAASAIVGADEMLFHGDRFKVEAVKTDEMIHGVRRVLVYGAAEG